MHIALTVGSFDRSGGIERVTVELALGYRALGHEVTVFATRWDPAFEGHFHFHRLRAPERPAWLRTLTLPRSASRALAHGRFDWVHGQGTSTLTCDLLTFHSVHAAWLAVSTRDDPPLKALAKRLYPFHRAAIAIERQQVRRHRGLIHACSKAVRDEVIAHYGADPDRVVAVPWGVDLEAFRPDAAIREEVRAAWGVAPGDRAVLFLANEFHRKGLVPTLEAMAQLDRRDLVLVVAGRADPHPYMPLVERLGLTKRVRFLGHQEAARCYRGADLFVVPSTYEGWGLVVGEALASGVPVVASRFPASDELITPGANGLLIDDPRDARALAHAIAQALAPETHAAMAAAARPSVERFAWVEVARQLAELGARSRDMQG